MSIQKKSLISTLKAAKKANVVSAPEADAKGSKVSSMRLAHTKQFSGKNVGHAKNLSGKNVGHAKNLSGKNVGHAKQI